MELLAFAISIPGITVLLLLWVVWIQRRRKLLIRRIEEHACAICCTGFSDALIEDRGPPAPAILARLDVFQRRFAHRAVVCQECGALNICDRDGKPFRGFAEF